MDGADKPGGDNGSCEIQSEDTFNDISLPILNKQYNKSKHQHMDITKGVVKTGEIEPVYGNRYQRRASRVPFPVDKTPEYGNQYRRRASRAVLPMDRIPGGMQKASSKAAHHIHMIIDEHDEDVHDIFCEMHELYHNKEQVIWKETARWIKFEEDVEEGGERWSKPFVGTLALNSLIELRKGMANGTFILDMDATTHTEIVELILDQMIASEHIQIDLKEKVMELLLANHSHPHDKDQLNHTSSLNGDLDHRAASKAENGIRFNINRTNKSAQGQVFNFSSVYNTEDQREHKVNQIKFNTQLLKKMSPQTEAAIILVGEDVILTEAIHAFVRIPKAVMLENVTEVPVPTRFIYLLLGPKGYSKLYHEIGRSVGVLMSDEVFQEIAYKAKNRGDILAAIDEFLEQVIVLPPGEWDPTIRIEPPKSVPSQKGRRQTRADALGLMLPNAMTLKENDDDEEHVDSTLIRTGRLFGGLIEDVKRKVPLYRSDFWDVLNIQCIASIVFMYFACLTPIITFGGLLGDATNNSMAAIESLLSGAICGVSYHLFAGQPLTVLGSTGPILVFETILHGFCVENGLNYLSFRVWIGLWVSAILFVIVAFDLSALVRYITRFTEESFATLIALIYIYEAFKKLIHILHDYPVTSEMHDFQNYQCLCISPNASLHDIDQDINMTTMASVDISTMNSSPSLPTLNLTNFTNAETNWSSVAYGNCEDLGGILVGSDCEHPRPYPDVFFFSCLIFIGTFSIAYALKHFKNTRYFPKKIRGMISDFSVMIAIVLMVGADAIVHLKTPKLTVPKEFKPTSDGRGWVINPFVNPIWTLPAGIIPALLGTILIFMDQQITAVIVNRKEYKLKKGCGYHLDLFIIAIQIALCSVLGTPWFVAATVLSINHVHSLRVESETCAPGESAKFLGIREQRVTGILVFLFVGLSVFLTTALKYIPMPVLYGVFLYMGVSSLSGVQLMQRIRILFMPVKYQPDFVFLRHVPLKRIYLFTLIQFICLAVLWVFKTIKTISIVFPVMVLAICFVRKVLDFVFTNHELKWLDDIMPESEKREKEDDEEEDEIPEHEDPIQTRSLKPLDGLQEDSTLRKRMANLTITEENEDEMEV